MMDLGSVFPNSFLTEYTHVFRSVGSPGEDEYVKHAMEIKLPEDGGGVAMIDSVEVTVADHYGVRDNGVFIVQAGSEGRICAEPTVKLWKDFLLDEAQRYPHREGLSPVGSVSWATGVLGVKSSWDLLESTRAMRTANAMCLAGQPTGIPPLVELDRLTEAIAALRALDGDFVDTRMRCDFCGDTGNLLYSKKNDTFELPVHSKRGGAGSCHHLISSARPLIQNPNLARVYNFVAGVVAATTAAMDLGTPLLGLYTSAVTTADNHRRFSVSAVEEIRDATNKVETFPPVYIIRNAGIPVAMSWLHGTVLERIVRFCLYARHLGGLALNPSEDDLKVTVWRIPTPVTLPSSSVTITVKLGVRYWSRVGPVQVNRQIISNMSSTNATPPIDQPLTLPVATTSIQNMFRFYSFK